MTRPLYADLSPGVGWNGRDPEALEAATATQVTTRTVSSFAAAGAAALAAIPRPLAFLVGGTVADAPAIATITGTSEGASTTETVLLISLDQDGQRIAAAVCGEKAWSAIDSVVYSAGNGTGGTVAIGLGLIPGVRDVRGQLSIATLINLLDHNHDGVIDRIALDVYAERASNELDSVLSEPAGNYPVAGSDGRAFPMPPPPKVADIAGDFFVAYLGMRYPDVVLADHVFMTKETNRQLGELRKAYRGTGKPAAEPPANVGGGVYPPPRGPARQQKFGPGKWGIY